MKTFPALAVSIALSTVLAAQSSPAPNLGSRAPGRAHAAVSAAPANVSAKAGGSVVLSIDVTPNPNIHVYAPGAKDYIPITVKIVPPPGVKLGKLTYPKSDTMTFADEKVPVFQKPFRLSQPVTMGGSLQHGTTVTVAGTVEYQACDDKVCYAPESVPVEWTVAVE